MYKGTVYVVDDDPDVLYTANLILKNKFKSVKTFNRPDIAYKEYSQRPADVVLLDMNFKTGATSGNEGIFWLKEFIKNDSNAHVILNTAYGDIDLAVQGMKEGAIDFLVKPWEPEKLLATVSNVYQLRKSKKKVEKLQTQNDYLERELSTSIGEIIYQSEAMEKVMNMVKKVGPTDASVLILGENGVGKELVARAIHECSKRSNNPFVKVDVGSLSENLFESELFGHVKGAFTDAKADRTGRFEIADSGSLFLDEIGNISADMQSKLLSVIQNRRVTRVGSNKEIPVDVRLISATNKDINDMICEERFREDLYFRINTVEIHIPPLRERREDIQLIANHFVKKYARKYEKESMVLTSEAEETLEEYSWPGNVRELDHSIERAVIMSDTDQIYPDSFALSRSSAKEELSIPLNLDEAEKIMIEKAIKLNDGNLSKAAKELGMGRATLYRKMEKYSIKQAD